MLQEKTEMGSQIRRGSSDPSGTNWTPAMETYFIHLLLDQVHRGNRMGYTFNKQAWNEILALFNAKFGYLYHINLLKSRYMALWMHFNNIKNLLNQNVFSWNETRQMVVANNHVWDAYIKAHHYAHAYRSKALANIKDLCLVYAHKGADGRYSLSSHDVDFDDDIQVVNTGNDQKEPKRKTNICEGGDENIQDCAIGDCSKTDWTPSMDRCLIDIMLEEVQRGYNIDYVLSGPAWIDMLILFKERFGIQFDKDYLKSCCKGLEKLYHDLRYILEQRGFSWDETKQMMEHPDAKSYRNHRKPNYNDLCLIYGNSDTELACNLANQNVGYDSVKFQNSHSTSDWTPPMDRYFMDLMLDEVRDGSMVNHKFDKLTWRDLVAKFRAQFGSQYDKDVLKSRCIILRKIFNDMKIVLNQSGFAWDEMQQMITADERLWDAYVKEYPDVKAYRYRTLPNFNDLFLIYGRNQNYSDCSRDAKDNDLSSDVGEYNQSPANDEPVRIAWTLKMDHYLIGLLLEQLNRGNKIGDTFSKKAWSWITESFNKVFGLLCDRDILENRYALLMSVYKDVKNLLNQNGIAWDEIQHTSRANDVWEAYVEEYTDVAFGETIRDNYNDLCLLFGNVNQNRRPGRVIIKLKTSNNNFSMETDKIMGDLQSSAREFKIPDGRKRRISQAVSTSSNARKVQKNLLGEMQEDLQEKKDNSIERIVAALQTIPDLDDELFLEACLLLEDERKARMFVAMDAAARRRWLLKKLHQ